ncbi:MAG: hypothetical protein KME42_13965 [Tildeniella nuda ZEHNDER 1965/U140]|jgi:hypothetical protein|nr:hypothetical protein [Tildeniella nuda ZEHNDER 1965/U140]
MTFSHNSTNNGSNNGATLPSTFDAFFRQPQAGDFIKQVEDGIEYYTEQTTGRSGMSHSGLGRMAGVAHPSIIYWERKISTSDPVNNSLPEVFKSFAGKALKLVNNSDPQGSEILPDDFCAAVIVYYASFASPKDQTQAAKLALMICTGIGLRTHIQAKTGWRESGLPVDKVVSTQPEPISTSAPEISDDRILEVMSAIKPHPFTKWHGDLIATNEGVAEWLEVTSSKVAGFRHRHREALIKDGVITRPVKVGLRKKLNLAVPTSSAVIWTPQAFLKLVQMVRGSEPAAKFCQVLGLPSKSKLQETIEVKAEPVKASHRQSTKAKTEPTKLVRHKSESQAKLALLKEGFELLEQIGVADDQDRLLLKNEVMHLLMSDRSSTQSKSAAPSERVEESVYFISDRCVELGYQPDTYTLLEIARKASRNYALRHGVNPAKVTQSTNGTTSKVNVYSSADLDILDEAIKAVMG